MSDWQVGDLAVCVNTDDIRHGMPGAGLGVAGRDLKLGAVYRVVGIAPQSSSNPNIRGTFLWLAERPSATASAARFRKIRPDEHQACEEEFVTLLRRSKVPETADGYDDFIRGGVPGVSGTVETRLATVVRIVRRGAK